MRITDTTAQSHATTEDRNLLLPLLMGAVVIGGLFVTSRYNYLLFHSLAELFSIVIAFGVYVVAWNSRRFLNNNYLLFVGIAYLFVGGLDTLHTLAYKGMGVIGAGDANPPTQLWIAARILQSLAMLAAPYFLGRKLNPRAVFAAGAGVFALLLWSIFGAGWFPDCYIEGTGLTPFKKDAEYAISAVLLLSGVALWRKRGVFDRRVLAFLLLSIVATIVSELAFTFYVGVYDLSNIVGHLFKIAAFYLVYLAIVKTGIRDPFEVIFRSLTHQESALREAKDSLEQRVAERTRELHAITRCNEVLVRADDEQALLRDVCRIVCDEAGYRMAWVGYREHDKAKTILPVVWAGAEDGYLSDAALTWADTERGRGPAGIAVRTGESACIQDFATDPHAAPWRAGALQRGYRSSIALPLKLESGETFGTLCIYSSKPGTFTAGETRLLGDLAGDLAFGIVVLRARAERRRNEDVLMRYAAIVESSDDAIITKTLDGIITSWNAGAGHLFGYDADEALGRPITMLIPDNYLDEERRIVAEIRQGLPVHHYDTVRRCKDGRLIDISVAVAPLRAPDGTIVGASKIARDITERKRAENELRRTAQDLRRAQRIARAGNWEFDVRARTMTCTGELWTSLGLPFAGKAVPLPEIDAFIPPEHRQRLDAAMAETLRTGEPYGIEYEMIGADGQPRWLFTRGELLRDEHGAAVGLRGVSIDIGERKEAEHRLRESEERLRLTLETTGIGIWDWDVRNDRWYASPTYYTMLGYEPRGGLADRAEWLERVHPDDRTHVAKKIQNVLTHDFKEYHYEARIRHADGSYRWVDVRGFGLERDADGKVTRMLGTRMDVTDRKNAETALHEYREHLEEQVTLRTAALESANRELESFSYSVSHDLRTPLRAIDGFSRMLVTKYGDGLDDEGKRLLRIVRDNAAKMSRLIDDILSFSRSGRVELRFTPVDMEQQVREVWFDLEPTHAGRNVRLDLNPLPLAYGDPAMLRQVWINLLSNAIKFTRPRAEAVIEVGCVSGPGAHTYYVHDNGVGFDPAYVHKLFGVFQRLHGVNEFEGTGIGLAIVKRIVTRHGGGVEADAKVGEGTTIRFTLPIQEG